MGFNLQVSAVNTLVPVPALSGFFVPPPVPGVGCEFSLSSLDSLLGTLPLSGVFAVYPPKGAKGDL